jgi:hypothetical protein
MNAKVSGLLVTALLVTSIAHPAIAEPLGEHPAVLVARTWSSRAIDPNTFIVLHPAGQRWLSESPTTKGAATEKSDPQAAKVPSVPGK